jgi:hypothetical protein
LRPESRQLARQGVLASLPSNQLPSFAFDKQSKFYQKQFDRLSKVDKSRKLKKAVFLGPK